MAFKYYADSTNTSHDCPITKEGPLHDILFCLVPRWLFRGSIHFKIRF